MVTDRISKLQKKLADTIRILPPILANEAINFSLNSFDQEAWSGNSQEVWKKRKNPTKWGKPDETGRALLMKTGQLKRSIQVVREDIDNGIIYIGAGGADTPYARAHNFGFRGKVDQNVRAFTRKMKNGKTQQVKEHQRTIHQNIPKRQYIGGDKYSPYLKARLRRASVLELKKIFK
ncbi:phage virion morphogenesis protein [Empedobacter falsenii]|uniref:phage virion morphogenesis protein n=1 Tax=Empedobacter falsenii TaxID=343874 RepID=UPI0025776CAC|nr:phage virion morphogenesis protein [Empedobacter falsenii]MDM1061932.1 phage virion morphogenesis protein [Empedobacter falsenii]